MAAATSIPQEAGSAPHAAGPYPVRHRSNTVFQLSFRRRRADLCL